ncbi:MAG: hypothetical protein HY391_02015 [Deltaproteobacteria bacterium]|nr:hypothetical protein [Deltaproteobacteria bacterium]
MKTIIFKLFLLPLVAIAFAVPAMADHPDPGQMDDVISLARDVYTNAYNAYYTASRERHHFTPRERYALEHLRFYYQGAYHFYNQVTQYRHDPSHTEWDYYRLVRSYQNAEWTFYDLHPTWRVVDAWNRARQAMDNLQSYYGYYDPHDPNHPHGPVGQIE